jgi:hypothetical protein
MRNRQADDREKQQVGEVSAAVDKRQRGIQRQRLTAT